MKDSGKGRYAKAHTPKKTISKDGFEGVEILRKTKGLKTVTDITVDLCSKKGQKKRGT